MARLLLLSGMMIRTLHVVVSLLVLATVPGCAKRTHVAEPIAVSPGTVVRITAERPAFRQGATPIVQVAGKPAAVVAVVNDREADVIVPAVPAGVAKVTADGASATSVDVLHAPSVELVLSFDGSTVTLLHATPRAGEVSAAPSATEERLSVDIVNEAGGLVWTGAVAHPTLGRREVYDGPSAKRARLHGVPPPKEAVFAVKVPSVPGRSRVRFFDAARNVDVFTSDGRSARKPVGEIVVDLQGVR